MSLNNHIKIIKDTNKNYLTFSLTKDGILELKKSISSDNIDISSALNQNVLAFDIYSEKTPSDKIKIAITTSNKEGKNSLYLTDYFDLNEFDWNKFKTNPNLWNNFPLEDIGNSFQSNLIIIDNAMISIAIYDKDNKSDASYYCADINDKKWHKYSLPHNTALISQILFGTIHKKRGVFLLYKTGNGQVILFQSFVDPKYGKISHYEFNSGKDNIESIASLYTKDGNSHLYAMSKREVFLFSNPNTKKIVKKSQNDFNIQSFTASKIVQDLNSISTLELKDKEQSEDKSNEYILGYKSQLFANIDFNLFIKNIIPKKEVKKEVKDLLYKDPEYKVLEIDNKRIILSALDNLHIGKGSDIGSLFSELDIIIYADKVTIDDEFNAKSLKIYANTIINNSKTNELNNNSLFYFQSDSEIDTSNPKVLELYDSNQKIHNYISLMKISNNLYCSDQEVKIGKENIDLNQTLFAHPVQCSMLLEKAKMIYKMANPINNQDAMKRAISLLSQIREYTKIFNNLKDNPELASLYKEKESSLGALNSITILKSIYQSANGLIGQIKKGNDYYGNGYNYVPLASLSLYSDILDKQIDNFSYIEENFNNFFNVNRKEEERISDLKKSRNSLIQIKSEADSQITALKSRADIVSKEISKLQAKFKEKRERVKEKMKEFKKDIENSFYLDLESLFDSLTSIASLGSDPMDWINVGYDIGHNIAQGVTTIQTEDGVVVEKDYLVDKLKVLEGELNSKNLYEESKKLNNGKIDYNTPATNKLVLEQNKLNNFLDSVNSQFPNSTKTLKYVFNDYVNLVLLRNKQIVFYNSIITQIITNHNLIKEANNKQNIINEDNLKNYQPNLPAFTTLMNDIYEASKAQVMETLYLTERAFRFWSVLEKFPVTNTFAGNKISAINTTLLKQAQSNIMSAYAKVIEEYGMNAQKFPAEKDGPGSIKYILNKFQIENLKNGLNGEYSILLKIPTAKEDSKKKDNVFASKANVRLLKVRVWLDGIKTSDNVLTLTISHTGDESIVNPNNHKFQFKHNPKKVLFGYNLVTKEIHQEGVIGHKDEDATYALVGPFTYWNLTISYEDNKNLDLSNLTSGYIEFHGTNYAFN